MINDVTSPHTKKVIATARVTGQMLGSGSLSGGSTVHPEFDSDDAGFDISGDMRLFFDGFSQG